MSIATKTPYDHAPSMDQPVETAELTKAPIDAIADKLRIEASLQDRTVNSMDMRTGSPVGRYSRAIDEDPIQKAAYKEVFDPKVAETIALVVGDEKLHIARARKAIKVIPGFTEQNLKGEDISAIESDSPDAVWAIQRPPHPESIYDAQGNHIGWEVRHHIISFNDLMDRIAQADRKARDNVSAEAKTSNRVDSKIGKHALSSTVQY